MTEKQLIKNNFSRCARHYDGYSFAQQASAADLASRIKGRDFSRILDIGCGTGNYTKFLMENFPAADIVALDISEAMLMVAKEKLGDDRIRYIAADAENIAFKERFDLVSSNAAFQWFHDLPKALASYKSLLEEDGVIIFSTFGPDTYRELAACMGPLPKDGYAGKQDLERAIRGIFRHAHVEEKIYVKEYASIEQLFLGIKYTGTRGGGNSSKALWTKARLDRLEKAYCRKFGCIKATYQVFLCEGSP